MSCNEDANCLRLLDLAYRHRWNSLAKRAALHPEEISEADESGLNVLHWVCANNAPTSIVATLLQYDKNSAIRAKDNDGTTPLMLACVSSDETICNVFLLVEWDSEQISMRDERGRTALFYACEVAAGTRQLHHLTVLRFLSQKDPALRTAVDRFGNTPLSITCQIFEFELRLFLSNAQTPLESTFWDIVEILIGNDVTNEERHLVLHRLIRTSNCPPRLIEAAIRHYGYLITATDADGNNLLHAAVKAQCFSSTLESLISANSQLVRMRNRQGFLPLQVAVQTSNEWNAGISSLLEAHPSALEQLELNEILYPKVLSKVPSPTMFEILRSRPSIMTQQ